MLINRSAPNMLLYRDNKEKGDIREEIPNFSKLKHTNLY